MKIVSLENLWNRTSSLSNNVNIDFPFLYFMIEVIVIITVSLLGFLVLGGSFRRFTRLKCLNTCLFVAYTTAPSMISYVLGKMHSSVIQDPRISKLYFASYESDLAAWTTFLMYVFVSIDNINAFSLKDNENHRRYWIQFLVFTAFFFVLTVQGHATLLDATSHTFFYAYLIYVQILLWLFWLPMFLRVKERQRAFRHATKSGVARNTKGIADFMRCEHTKSEESELDPASLKGYKYLVSVKNEFVPSSPSYQMEIDIEKAVTLEKVWQCEGDLLSSTGDPRGHLKDLCLSFSLFWLLLRRYGGHPLHESNKLKTWRLIRDGLLRNREDATERVFRVIEVELKFLHDYFYTKCYASYDEDKQIVKRFSFFALVLSFLGLYFGRVRVPKYLELTHVIIVSIALIELVQLGILVTSEWYKVKFICYYVQKKLWKSKRGKWLGKMIPIVCRVPNLKPWGRRLGQYSLLCNYGYDPCIYRVTRCCINELVEIPRPGQSESASIELSVELKEALISSLQLNGQKVSNGISSLRRNGVQDDWLIEACQLETHTHVILVWHIATSLCEMATGLDKDAREHLKDFRVAKHLSMYCAYLVAFAPKLIPDLEYTATLVFDQLIIEAKKLFQQRGCHKVDRYQVMMDQCDPEELDSHEQTKTNMERAALLAKRIMCAIPDEERRWKVLADFWANKLLFLAPSDDPSGHAEHLVRGGELITHLWALLTHAGILERPLDCSDESSQSV